MAEDRVQEDVSSLEGRYANHFRVGHNAFEVILAFGQFYRGDRRPVLHSKIVTSPTYAKELLLLLRNFVEEYETRYGVIEADKASRARWRSKTLEGRHEQ